ncbi:LuxR C-terminal-related transcriptional regulator [Stappia stellulata]|uniref:LuxR C-terminal-related transcriptional regulator n=1 Tax=Stappia stellulata TaxID=71235 RepID=UPI0004276D8B|nr:LuxR C-terminal-related transcriptional regulator [Stappia stellulata]
MSFSEDASGRTLRSTADLLMSVAEAVTPQTLSEACGAALARITGSGIVGIYLVDAGRPHLLGSTNVPMGLLGEYRTGLGVSDPYLERLSEAPGVLDGHGFYGTHGWRQSRSYELLRGWGLCSNMCGPLLREGEVAGVLYTATDRDDRPYTARMKHNMALLCRAASVALPRLLPTAGETEPEMRLPPRQAEVAALIRQGFSNKAVARELGLSEHTVKEYVAILCRRFSVRNRTQLGALIAQASSFAPPRPDA